MQSFHYINTILKRVIKINYVWVPKDLVGVNLQIYKHNIILYRS